MDVCIRIMYKARECVSQKEVCLEELGSRKFQIVGPEARFSGCVQIRLITDAP